MRFAFTLATFVLLNCSLSSAQGIIYYDAFYAPAPVVVAPVQPIVQMSYVPQPVVTYAVRVVAPTQVYYAPVAVAAPVAHSPFSVAARENAWVNRNGVNYTYREYGPLGAQRYHYTVHARPNGYVVRERGY